MKTADPELLGSQLVALRGGALRFRLVATFRGVSGCPKRTTDHDPTTPTRDSKIASRAIARPVPSVRRLDEGHGGAVVLAVGRVAFVLWATPRDARTTLNDSDAAV